MELTSTIVPLVTSRPNCQIHCQIRGLVVNVTRIGQSECSVSSLATVEGETNWNETYLSSNNHVLEYIRENALIIKHRAARVTLQIKAEVIR